MIIDESTAIEILGEEQYYDCVSLFQEVFERKSDYKIMMTRRCSSLFKIFSPILRKRGITNQHGIIITDKALCFYMNEIENTLKNSLNSEDISILIVDDIIIYGRTINSIIDEILPKFSENNSQKTYLNQVLVRCIMKNKFNSQIKTKYSKMVISQSFGSKSDWKKLSCDFSTLIKSANIANTSYIISYKTSFEDILMQDKFLNYCKSNAVDKTSEELERLHVTSYVMEASLDVCKNLMTRFVSCCWLRIYFYKSLNSIVVSPLVILNELNENEVYELAQFLINKFKLENAYFFKEILLSKNKNYYSAKIRLLILLLSHSLLCYFLNSSDSLVCTIDKFDYQEILQYNFTDDLAKEFEKVHKNICSTTNFRYKFISQEELDFANEEKVEKFLFRRAMMDNQKAISETSNRLEGISEIECKSIFLPHMMPTVLTLIDTGKAALRTFFDNSVNKFVSKVYPGEQAFRIMEDKYKKYLLYFHNIERYSKIHNLNSYSLYRDFTNYILECNFISKNEAISLLNYIQILEDTNQQISDVYVYDMMCVDGSLEEAYNTFVKRKLIF